MKVVDDADVGDTWRLSSFGNNRDLRFSGSPNQPRRFVKSPTVHPIAPAFPPAAGVLSEAR